MWRTASDNLSQPGRPIDIAETSKSWYLTTGETQEGQVFSGECPQTRMLLWNWIWRKETKNNSPSFMVRVFSFVYTVNLLQLFHEKMVKRVSDVHWAFPAPSSLVSCHSACNPSEHQSSSSPLPWCWLVNVFDLPAGFPSAHSTGRICSTFYPAGNMQLWMDLLIARAEETVSVVPSLGR